MPPRRPSPPPAPPPEGLLTVESVGGEGDGVVRTAEGRLLHVPGALPGEVIRLGAGSDGPVLVSVDRASPDRRAPPCPHFGTCGGCALQHWDHAAALAWKVGRLRATLALERLETDILPVVTTAPGGRRRAALHARRGPTRTEARIGFKARRSWSLVELSDCAVLDPAITRALPLLRRLAAPLLEHPKSAPALHVTVTDTGLDIDVTGVEARSGGLSADARQLAAEVAGQGDIARLTLAGEILFQQRQPVVRLGRARVVLPPGAFLQAAPVAEAAMAAEAVAAADGARRIADLFCGVGTFTFPLAEVAPVLAVDSSAPAIAALVAAVATAPGLHGITAETRDLFRRPVAAAELRRIDVIVFDPPRAGAIAQTAEIAQSGAARVVGVSCNPATFARDARRLVDEGFRLERVRPVDQFLWSPHLELVAVFSR
ncbi:MAG: class I SAM-dependent RNA methyltransferase [Phenylobacterium sp.]|uniref:class I SAM-dependent RNA methyltransferase n=1 Tax=Phenylobacterium sp. TaxID=1871053 RepID=UPI0025D0983C|nr:RNA methyltransferase [Phenylobacterium sp.]MCA6335495.1 class I SAM-dependent RNA methyltransferase [Phenylobacterium sp.]